jgi:NADH-quinone oxidoreductase subunit N
VSAVTILADVSFADVSFEAPQIDGVAVLPMLLLFASACAGVLVEAFVPRAIRAMTQTVLALAGLLGSLAAVVYAAGTRTITASGALAIDGPALFLQGSIALLGIVSVLLMADRVIDAGGSFVAQAAVSAGTRDDRAQLSAGYFQTEIFPLASFALAGMMLFVSANDLLLMFVALEVLSLPLYLLCGLARRRRLLSQEAAVKYFLLGAFASAFFLYADLWLRGQRAAFGHL